MKILKNNFISTQLNRSVFKIFYFKKNLEADIVRKLQLKYPKEIDLANFVVKKVLEDGFIKLPSLDEKYLEKITEEYNYLMNFYKNLNVIYEEKEGTLIRLRPLWRLNGKRFRYTFSFFHNKFFFNIAKIFFNKRFGNFSFNNEIFFHKTRPTKIPLAGDYHYDIRQTLKFWLYMNNIEDKNGPMSVEKMSATRNQNLLNQEKSDNKVNVDLYNCEKLVGKKGSIFIHDTTASHRANIVEEGYERNIIRAHSWL
jgi:hypothetical protein